MSLLTILLLIIPSLILPTISMHIATFDQVGSSQVQFFTDSPPINDHLISTFCYCASIHAEGNSSHYFQTDYYNAHDATTYIITSTCLADHNCHRCHTDTNKVADTCDLSRNRDCTHSPFPCSRSPIANDYLLIGKYQRRWERKWFHLSWASFWHGRCHDHLVYWPDHHGKGRDKLEFNGQWRDLSKEGGQGMRALGGEESEGVCERACWDQVGSGVQRGGGSRQVVYDRLRNMWYGCP